MRGTIRGTIVIYCLMPYKDPKDKTKWRSRYAKENQEKCRAWAATVRANHKKHSPPKVLSREVRERVFERYGARCVHCGCRDKRVLDVDHINGRAPGDSRKDWQRKGSKGTAYAALKAPDGIFRILCRNCNWIAWLDRKDRIKAATEKSRGKC